MVKEAVIVTWPLEHLRNDDDDAMKVEKVVSCFSFGTEDDPGMVKKWSDAGQ